MNKKEKGNIGEAQATKYLRGIGYKIIEKNVVNKAGEVDIIATDKDYIVFVEVKARSSMEFGSPSQAVTSNKKLRYIRFAKLYAMHNKCFDKNIRFDIIEVFNGEITHIINAFQAN